MAEFNKHNKEISVCIKDQVFLNHLSDCHLLNKDSATQSQNLIAMYDYLTGRFVSNIPLL